MNDDAERTALGAGYRIVQGLTLLAGAMVAITGLSAGGGFFFYFGYLSTVGAPWVRDLLPISMLVQMGALHLMVLASVTLLAMLKFSGKDLPRIRGVVIGWAILMALGGLALAHTAWHFVLFAMQVVSGVAAVLTLPVVIIRAARAWHGRVIGIVVMLINMIAIGTVFPLSFGVAKGLAERAQPSSLSAITLKGGKADIDWRLVTAFGDRFLITRNVDGVAFREYKVVAGGDVETIRSNRAGAPWAP
jgi:hypothetical protein